MTQFISVGGRVGLVGSSRMTAGYCMSASSSVPDTIWYCASQASTRHAINCTFPKLIPRTDCKLATSSESPLAQSLSDNHPMTNAPGIQASSSERPTLPFLDQVKATRLTSPLDTPSTEGARGTKGLPYIKELITSKIRRTHGRPSVPSTEFVSRPSAMNSEIVTTPISGVCDRDEAAAETIKMGKLLKTSRVRSSENSEPNVTKQKRFWIRKEQRLFRLTEDAIEYYQQFNQVKLRRNYPLTSIEQIVYNDDTEPAVFHLLFTKYEMILEADSEDEARSWVDSIRDAWSKWNTELEISFNKDNESVTQHDSDNDSIGPLPSPPPEAPSPVDGVFPSSPIPSPSSHEEIITAYETEKVPAVGGVETPSVKAHSRSRPGSFVRPRAHSALPMLRRESRDYDMETLGRKKRKNAFRLAHLTPRLELPKQEPTFPVQPKRHQLTKMRSMAVVQDPESKVAISRLHYNFAMVKYPCSTLGIPHERIFKIDNDNLQILWRRNAASNFRLKSSLQLHKVVEVREGQLTDSFEKFPYEEVKEQSFSLIFEEEGKKYVRLSSIDLICDHPDNYDQWMEGLRSLVSGTKCSIYPHLYENTDPLVLWLKQIWNFTSDNHEIKTKDAVMFVRKLRSQLSIAQAKELIKISHSHQFKHTIGQANLRWDGFLLLYNLTCTTSHSTPRLKQVFSKYAKQYPSLGMTVDELREFLVEECFWDRELATDSDMKALIKHHGYHHRAYNKYVAKNRPLQYQLSSKMLTYAGFLSFLRSKDNPVIDLEHETIYQDMTQPLSHYFINSSHNTYLESDQLKGKSSLDAYIRALLQGCRCVEIDCWDDTFNVTGLDSKEPVIYHGYTLTSKIPFREVVHTVRDYSFSTTSHFYPVIISIENHCSEEQQSRMAKIFRAIMGDVLPTENLVELEGRERLPSPQDLQGKILLKGTFRKEVNKGNTTPRTPRVKKGTSEISLPMGTPSHPPSLVSTSSLVSQSSTEIEEYPSSPVTGDLTNSVNATPTHAPNKESKTRTRTFSYSRTGQNRRSSRKSLREVVTEKEKGQDDQELVFEETSKDLKKLIKYCRAVSIKPWSWRRQQETTVSEMFSFGEPTAIKLCSKSTRDMLRCTERQLVRTYPKGTRFDSSNYDPMQMWKCGVQMVALNFQKPDIHMHLNQGFFRRNGGCGYILKPAVMRKVDPGGTKGGSAPFSPFMEVSHPDVPTINFEIELLSGQNLCPWNKKSTTFTVDIHTYGLQHDTAKMVPPATHTDTLWPQWEERAHTLSKSVILPELCLVYFRVESDKKLLGQNCISLVSLQPGYKFIPLRTAGGELIPHAGLFVKIKKEEIESNYHSRTYPRNTSLTGNTLDPISENPEASLNPLAFKRGFNHQAEMDEDDEEEEDSIMRRTMSSPPSITGHSFDVGKKSPSPGNKMEVVVELAPTPEEVTITLAPNEGSLTPNRVRSVSIQPSYQAPPTSEADTKEEDAQQSKETLKEFTLTVQGSFDEGGY